MLHPLLESHDKRVIRNAEEDEFQRWSYHWVTHSSKNLALAGRSRDQAVLRLLPLRSWPLHETICVDIPFSRPFPSGSPCWLVRGRNVLDLSVQHLRALGAVF